jgi:hypothetical protein
MPAPLDRMNDYWRAVSEGWWPSLPRNGWVGSYHPWEPAPRAERWTADPAQRRAYCAGRASFRPRSSREEPR